MNVVAGQLPVVWMAIVLDWPIVLALVALPLLLLLWRMRSGGWANPRRRRAARVGFLLGIPLGGLIVFGVVGGSLGDLGYWLDWVFLGLASGALAAYFALLSYLLMRPSAA